MYSSVCSVSWFGDLCGYTGPTEPQKQDVIMYPDVSWCSYQVYEVYQKRYYRLAKVISVDFKNQLIDVDSDILIYAK